ncbi:MAG: DUF2935 domain-containing protein [Clostridia bacterium]|nr:DUF2935 domain-containing protein [Clostridia bacterium]
MDDFTLLSIETHLFFGRIMKEHALFLEAGFPCCEKSRIEEANLFRREFEDVLSDLLRIDGITVSDPVLHSNELITEFTIPAERKTEALSGIPINSDISSMTRKLHCECSREENRCLTRQITAINERVLCLLNQFICFKERLLCDVKECRLFTANYPLLIEHITREAKLYREILERLQGNRCISYQNLYETEAFWNQIMMEHAWFIRGLLDPSEAELISTADDFSKDYARLLKLARRQDCKANSLTSETLEETKKYRDFKTAGADGILNCRISSIILPLLADHVLREANHYIRVLETGRTR